MNGTEWLLDTNVVIGLLKQRAAAITLIETHQFDLSKTAVSQITRMELLGFPSLAPEEEDAIVTATALVHRLTLLTLDQRLEKLTAQLSPY